MEDRDLTSSRSGDRSVQPRAVSGRDHTSATVSANLVNSMAGKVGGSDRNSTGSAWETVGSARQQTGPWERAHFLPASTVGISFHSRTRKEPWQPPSVETARTTPEDAPP